MAVALSSSSSSFLNVFIVGFVLLLVVPHLLLHVSCKAGFSVELIMNRDSPKSHPASTPLSRLHSSIRHSASYTDYLRTPNSGNANSPLVSPNHGNANSLIVSINRRGFSALVTGYYSHYLVSFKIGSNGHNVSVVLEVADDFTWLLCDPCPTCPKPEDRPIFNPSKSDTYNKLDCDHEYCKLFEKHNCDDEHMCHFSHKYYMGTAIGTLSAENVTVINLDLGTDAYLNQVLFGCTNGIEGKHFEGSMGILGLGSGPLSLISQMAQEFDKKFSYCLPRKIGSSSYLNFGGAAKNNGGVLSTHLYSSDHPFHKIKLTGIDVTFRDKKSSHLALDNIVISTSILYTYIGDESLQFIQQEVIKHVGATLPRTIYRGYNLCYRAPANYKMPKMSIILIFENHAQLILKVNKAFVRVGNTALCLTILSNKGTSRISVLGSLAQKGNLMLFDVDKKMLHFRHQDC